MSSASAWASAWCCADLVEMMTVQTPWADPEVMRTISARFSDRFEQLHATRFMLPAMEEPEPIVQERLSSHKELPDDVKATIEVCLTNS